MPDCRENLAWRAFDRVADSYAREEHLRAERELYETPALRSLMGDLAGRRTLDLCCGSGENAVWMAQRGAMVSAVDGSPHMLMNLALTSTRLGLRIAQSRTVLPGPLEVAAESQDLVIMALALHFFESWEEIVLEIRRVLRPGGEFLASVCHPSDVLYSAGPYVSSYFTASGYTTRRYGAEARVFRRSLESTLAPFLQHGFALTGLVEPRLCVGDSDIEGLGTATRRLRYRPKWLCFRMRKSPVPD